MTRPDRKAMIAAYKDQPTIAGVFAVVCTATGEAWVGRSRHIDTHRNGLWFSLRQGACPCRSLQQAWREHDEADFRFEQLDRLPADISALARDMELKDRAARWRDRLRAHAL